MKFYLLSIFAFFLVTFSVNGSNGALSEEVYWKSKLPHTPLPKALQELLLSGNESRFAHAKDILESKDSCFHYVKPYGKAHEIDKKIDISNKTTIYLLYNNLHPYKMMNLSLTKSIKGSKFLPRKIADSIPFSSNKSRDILDYFSIKPASKEAQIIKQTIKECEAPNIRGEDKYCATSFESLVDFVTAKFGKNVKAFSNEIEEEIKKKEYTILKGIKMIRDNPIVCHKQRYKYAVYYCHVINATKAYMVPLIGDNGSKAKAVVVCHSDTSAWNPNHFAFQVLNVKPGGPTICHFLNNDAIVWVST
ncbi:BURP domain-containing protein 5-like isoform X2 [Mercurialis annua]|uniref:BURP domain-containing protein 5-like isoform X2 n=1 Tax=Mercurialis annua TaxID=3986 RepID=UPI002161027C|nr:BURP domain-containing protein 5-like isoform X2 [Mercurialis annua]